MKIHRAASLVVLLGTGVLGLALTGCGKTRAFTQVLQPKPKGVVVSNVTTTVDPAGYSGECPALSSFTAEIAVTDSGAVAYRWERSDGYVGEPRAIWFPAAGTATVATAWSPVARGSYWERLHVLLPEEVVSDRAAFANQCVHFTA